MNHQLDLTVLSELIRSTQTINNHMTLNELIKISSKIQKIIINNDNIHCVLKLIANLLKFQFVINSDNKCFDFDIDKLITYIFGNIDEPTNLGILMSNPIETKNDSLIVESYNERKINILDGDIISLVNIYCSKKINAPYKAIKLINYTGIHKNSSYIPVLIFLIETKNINSLKIFYNNFLEINKKIIQHNHSTKIINQDIRNYNEKIKNMKRIFLEFYAINDEIKDIKIPINSYHCINTFASNINKESFNEVITQTERNIITLSDDILNNILNIAINHNEHTFIHNIIKIIKIPSPEIIISLNLYFTKFKYNTVFTNIYNGVCVNCNNIIKNNVISIDDRKNIMCMISKKIQSISYRHINNQLISDYERQNINTKWLEFINILDNNKFDIIVDGANLGYTNSKENNNINIKFILNIINNIIINTNKKILLILHQRHTQKIKQLIIPNNIINNLLIYITPNNVNDDWFWLYASIHSVSYIISNDQSRDHGCMVAYQNEIKKWNQVYQIPININDKFNPNYLYSVINSINTINPGIFINNDKLHIVVNSNNTSSNCICVDINI